MTGIAIRRSITFAALGLCVVSVLAWASIGRMARAFTSRGDPWVDGEASTPSDHAVVVVELFTSEGCSSCPPADEVLSRLVREPLGGTVVLGLGEHVDYWDRLGWKDPFSSAVFSRRQSEYQSQVFRTGSIYTPQLVVDGQLEAVGSDVQAVRRAIAASAKAPKAAIDIAAWPADTGHLYVHVAATLPPTIVVREQSELVVVLTQDNLTSDVRFGENRGRRLEHSAVVRSFAVVGTLTPPIRTFDATVTLPVTAAWKLPDVRIVGLLQERSSRRIVGAGFAHVSAGGGPPL